ncbi:hypothetical protein N9Q05_02315 [bacterium]|nr:hypothetical protein [bacterium]
MEPDRFQQNQVHYIVGLVCLVASLSLFAFCAYTLPYLMFSWHYTIPEFVLEWNNTLTVNYQFSTTAASWILFLGFFFPALIFAIIADVLSNHIDNEIHGIEPTKTVIDPHLKESSNLALRIILIMILVFVAAELFQWIISTPAS